MRDSFNSRGDYRIEISGWGLDNSFFAERTALQWAEGGEKQVQLHRALPEGATVFVRLLSSEPSCGSVPVAYQARNVVPMDRNGRCQMQLVQLHPRPRVSSAGQDASNVSGASKEFERDLETSCDAGEIELEMVPVEALR
jgi:hypothetical protein